MKLKLKVKIKFVKHHKTTHNVQIQRR